VYVCCIALIRGSPAESFPGAPLGMPVVSKADCGIALETRSGTADVTLGAISITFFCGSATDLIGRSLTVSFPNAPFEAPVVVSIADCGILFETGSAPADLTVGAVLLRGSIKDLGSQTDFCGSVRSPDISPDSVAFVSPGEKMGRASIEKTAVVVAIGVSTVFQSAFGVLSS